MVTALARTDDGFTPQEIVTFLRRRVEDHLLDVVDEYASLTLVLDHEGYVEAARLLQGERRLAFTMFDCLFGVDMRDEGFDVVAILYSVETGQRVLLRTRCEGGRDAPTAPTLTQLWQGANFHEREAWDMFGIEFEGHPGLAPRILCAENFEGWPLRKDFFLGTRAAKPWPGVKEPAELDDEGNVIERVVGPGDAPGPTALDEAMGKQARLANPKPEPETPEELDADIPPGAQAVVEGDAERVQENLDEAESAARARAEQRRKDAAEARAEKAAERAAEGEAPADATPPIPQGDQRQIQPETLQPGAAAEADEDPAGGDDKHIEPSHGAGDAGATTTPTPDAETGADPGKTSATADGEREQHDPEEDA